MFYTLTAIFSILLLLITIGQAIFVFRYQRFLTSGLSNLNRSGNHDFDHSAETVDGKAAIILCLRGTDPTLTDCLSGIVGQNYRDFQIHIVFDALDDPAVDYVRAFFEDVPAQPVLHFNETHLKTCSLKCSGLITAITALPENIEYVALIDADTVADETWLIDLLAPFADPRVGATTGNRWFTPSESSIGSVFRKIWNAASVPQVALYNIGWGGSLAFRRSALEEANFLESWKSAFCEDTMVAETLEPIGMTLQRAPCLIMENTESSTLPDAFRWIVRQMLTVRLHHRVWPLVMTHGLLTAIACYGTPVLILAAFIFGEYSSAKTLIYFFLIYQLINIGLLLAINHFNRTVLHARADGRPSEQDASNLWATVVATVLNQFLFPLAVYRTWKIQAVDWRGITYQIDSSKRIEMETYVPYREVLANHSLESATGSGRSIH